MNNESTPNTYKIKKLLNKILRKLTLKHIFITITNQKEISAMNTSSSHIGNINKKRRNNKER